MKIIKNKNEFEKMYERECYSIDQIEDKDYPFRYPCIVIAKESDGGLMGESRWLEIHYCPIQKNYDFDSFAFGFEAGFRASN